MHFEMSSAQWPPFCLGLNVLRHTGKLPAILVHVCTHNVSIFDSVYFAFIIIPFV